MSNIIFRNELVETEKDPPKEGVFSKPELEDEMPKTAALCCHLTKPIWVWMHGNPSRAWKERHFWYHCFQEKGCWLASRIRCKHCSCPHAGKGCGVQTVHNASSKKYPGTNLWLAAMVDSKHTSIMAITWSTTLPKAKRKCCIGGELVEIDYAEYMHWYYFSCHYVDDSNNNCQGWLLFEEAFTLHC